MTVAGEIDKLSEFAERVARAIAADQGEAYAEHKSEYDSYGRVAASALVTELQYRVTSDEAKQVGDVVEQWLIAAYARGVEWNEENPLDREYRFKAAGDFADKALNDPTSSLRAALTFLAASPSSPASGVRVKVKPLIWVDEKQEWPSFAAESVFGTYRLIEERPGVWLVAGAAACRPAKDCPNPDEWLKQWAQRNLEARILSALGEHP